VADQRCPRAAGSPRVTTWQIRFGLDGRIRSYRPDRALVCTGRVSDPGIIGFRYLPNRSGSADRLPTKKAASDGRRPSDLHPDRRIRSGRKACSQGTRPTSCGGPERCIRTLGGQYRSPTSRRESRHRHRHVPMTYPFEESRRRADVVRSHDGQHSWDSSGRTRTPARANASFTAPMVCSRR